MPDPSDVKPHRPFFTIAGGGVPPGMLATLVQGIEVKNDTEHFITFTLSIDRDGIMHVIVAADPVRD